MILSSPQGSEIQIEVFWGSERLLRWVHGDAQAMLSLILTEWLADLEKFNCLDSSNTQSL